MTSVPLPAVNGTTKVIALPCGQSLWPNAAKLEDALAAAAHCNAWRRVRKVVLSIMLSPIN
jgi:hypothetical protein